MSSRPITAELSSISGGDAAAVIDAAMAAAGFQDLHEGRVWGAAHPDGTVSVVDVEDHLNQYRDRPRRKAGRYAVHDAASFAAYLSKHALVETEVWADIPNTRVTAVINAHTDVVAGDEAGHEDHVVSYAVQPTVGWQRWLHHDGKLMTQSDFAELIEDRAIDIVKPTAADMLELAETFQATIGVNFESSKLLSSGERQLEYRETVDAKAGKTGRLEIPKDFTLALMPFEGAKAYGVRARFRYRITDGTLRIGYRLERPEDVLREAFLDVVQEIADHVTAPVFRGSGR